MGDKYKKELKEIELKYIYIQPWNTENNTPKRIEFNEEYIKDIKCIIKKYIEHKLKS